MYRLFITFSIVAAILLTSPVHSNTNIAPQQTAALAAPVLANLQLFSTEDAAQKHCPQDIVVWLNTSSGIYHLKGERWYGRTKHGAYVCKKEADAAGDRETENGQ